MISAGAVSVGATPAFGSTWRWRGLLVLRAGTALLFANDGTRLSQLLSPVVVSGVDGIATTRSGGLGNFYGTSAASASLAGVAALLLSANPNLTSAQLEQILEQTALPMANPDVSGAGLAQVNPAITAAVDCSRLSWTRGPDRPSWCTTASSTSSKPAGPGATEIWRRRCRHRWCRNLDPHCRRADVRGLRRCLARFQLGPVFDLDHGQQRQLHELSDRRGVRHQRDAEKSGKHLPSGSQWRRRDRHASCRHRVNFSATTLALVGSNYAPLRTAPAAVRCSNMAAMPWWRASPVPGR